MNTMTLSTPPMAIHGLNLPQRVRVASTTLPMIGSLKASNTRAATMMTLMQANCTDVSVLVNNT